MAEPKRREAASWEPGWARDEARGDRGPGPAGVAGIGALMAPCCLAPVLLAGGLTGWMARLDPLWTVAAAIAGAAGLGFWLRRRVASARLCCNRETME